MKREQCKREVCDFLDSLEIGDVSSHELDEGAKLEEVGLVDSLAALEIATFLQERYGVDYLEDGIQAERLDSIGGILDLIEGSAV